MRVTSQRHAKRRLVMFAPLLTVNHTFRIHVSPKGCSKAAADKGNRPYLEDAVEFQSGQASKSRRSDSY